MFKNVVYDRGIFTATDETDRDVIITESISFLFEVLPSSYGPKKSKKRIKYDAITYRSTDLLAEIENYLCGKDYNKTIIGRVVVRFGWMNKRLNSLVFISLKDLVHLVRAKEATPTQVRKFLAICKQLSISQKVVLK